MEVMLETQQYVAYQTTVACAFTKLSIKSHSINIDSVQNGCA